ncbi:helix-turn-helix domain-containing protein [Kitasatospora purpeofusca]|uniref:helix-turn-helix domain-containing protein n=1 Tax=Kitasatospora purpeofusca TaxID=67352 RepID=UPI0033F22A6E
MDSTARKAARRGLEAFRRGWETQVGDDVFQLPAFNADTVGDFRVKGNVAKVHGAAIADLHAASVTRTADVPGGDTLAGALRARELNFSVRTLHRAFAAVGEQVTAHIRHRRLDEARLALDEPSGRLSITEIAAHWQFADGSHFTRAFKKRYGRTPTEYARSGAGAR